MDAATSSYALSGVKISKSDVSKFRHDSSVSSGITRRTFRKLQLQTSIQNGKSFCSTKVWTHPLIASEPNSDIEDEKVEVLLLNLGGPETLHDDIIQLPRLFRFLQRPLAQLISTLTVPKSKEGYASIGGGSPLRKITDEQANALKMALEEKKVDANVYVAMRY
ncbi:hypothetical protein L2E82_20870 [Cichorium intybus]|uniref:Uncharacterized protein n=1 Tax=Cichorium intybus TaxID=13427 RepID=A0ACB9DVD1_CICIN|nr:hypothetical protein L2E82_20870 [Cichorium intybus]